MRCIARRAATRQPGPGRPDASPPLSSSRRT